MPLVVLVCPDAAHASAADVLCPADLVPDGWTRMVVSSPNDVPEGAALVGAPQTATLSATLARPGRLVVSGHYANSPTISAQPWIRGVVSVGGRAAAGNTPATSGGAGLWLCLDTGPRMPANTQSWPCYAATLYALRAWSAHGSAAAAAASLVAAAQSASGHAEWTETSGYGVLPAFVLPTPGSLLSTESPAWALFGAPAGGSITPMTTDGHTGVRIVAGAGSDRLRARALDAAAYVDGRLYRRRVFVKNLSGTSTAYLVSRVSETPYRVGPGESMEVTVWEVRSRTTITGYNPSFQLRSGLVDDVPGAVLEVFLSIPTVDTYEATGDVALAEIAPPDPVAPYDVTATPNGTPGVYAISWHTLPDPLAPCIVSVDGTDVVTASAVCAVYLVSGTHEVRVRTTTGESEAHSTVTVTSMAAAVTLTRGRSSIFATWSEWPGAVSYRAEFADSLGGAPFAVVETTGRAAEVEFDSPAEARIIAIAAGGAETEVGRAYAAGAGTPSRYPLYT